MDPQNNEMLNAVMPLVIMAFVMYFIIIRPQNKERRKHAAMLQDLGRGDSVMLSSGMLGTVVKVDHDKALLSVEVSEGVIVKVMRDYITNVTEKRSTVASPANGNTDNKKSKKAV